MRKKESLFSIIEAIKRDRNMEKRRAEYVAKQQSKPDPIPHWQKMAGVVDEPLINAFFEKYNEKRNSEKQKIVSWDFLFSKGPGHIYARKRNGQIIYLSYELVIEKNKKAIKEMVAEDGYKLLEKRSKKLDSKVLADRWESLFNGRLLPYITEVISQNKELSLPEALNISKEDYVSRFGTKEQQQGIIIALKRLFKKVTAIDDEGTFKVSSFEF